MSISALLDDIRTRIRLLFTRGRVRLVDPREKGLMQIFQATGLEGETLEGIEHFQPYGLESKPLPGAEGFLLAILGQRGQLIGFVHDVRHRPEWLKDGETCLYSAHGQHVWLDRDGHLRIRARTVFVEGERMEVNAGETVVNSERVTLKSDNIALGGPGGQRVARIGDRVRVGSGSSAGDWPIVEGSEKVRAT